MLLVIDWQDFLGKALMAVLIPLATVLGTMVGTLIKELIGKIKNERLQQLAQKAVLWAEQKLQDLDGEEKFAMVYDYLASKFPYLDSEDIEKAIEAAVAAMNTQIKKK